jgi:hypothetical protein
METAVLVETDPGFFTASIKASWTVFNGRLASRGQAVGGEIMDWSALWDWLSNPSNQQTLAWIGGGAAAVGAGVWTVIKFLHGKPSSVSADRGGTAVGGTVTASGAGSVAIGGSGKGATIVTSSGNTVGEERRRRR